MCICMYEYVWCFGSVCHLSVSMCVRACVYCVVCVCVCVLYGVCVLYVVSWENEKENAFVMRL